MHAEMQRAVTLSNRLLLRIAITSRTYSNSAKSLKSVEYRGNCKKLLVAVAFSHILYIAYSSSFCLSYQLIHFFFRPHFPSFILPKPFFRSFLLTVSIPLSNHSTSSFLNPFQSLSFSFPCTISSLPSPPFFNEDL